MSKINSGTVLLGFFALLFGLIGTWAFRELSKTKVVEKAAVVAPPAKKFSVPLASRRLEEGHVIKTDDIAVYQMTHADMKKNGITGAFMSQVSQIVGKVVSKTIPHGDTFDTLKFYPEGKAPGIATRLQPGDRAVTISLTPTNALLGFAGAGQIVDVLFHYGERRPIESPNNETVPDVAAREQWRKQFQSATVTLVENAEILALGDLSTPTEDANGIPLSQRVLVTLALSPRDAEAIRVADGNGELSLSLRNPYDTVETSTGVPRMLSEIIAVEPSVQRMEVFRGMDSIEMEFEKSRTQPKNIVKASFANPRNAAPLQKKDLPPAANPKTGIPPALPHAPTAEPPVAETNRDDYVAMQGKQNSGASEPLGIRPENYLGSRLDNHLTNKTSKHSGMQRRSNSSQLPKSVMNRSYGRSPGLRSIVESYHRAEPVETSKRVTR